MLDGHRKGQLKGEKDGHANLRVTGGLDADCVCLVIDVGREILRYKNTVLVVRPYHSAREGGVAEYSVTLVKRRQLSIGKVISGHQAA